MFIKIFFNDKPLYLCDTVDETIQPFIHHDEAVFIDELNTHTIKAMIHEMQQPQVHAGVFFHTELPALQKAFWKKFTIVKAAGGLVFNEKKELLMIFRRGKWDLPKGKQDSGETLEECAIREVEEETGLTKVQLLKPLLTTFHTYHEGSKFILKESCWYTMKTEGKQNLQPQTEEDILEIKWVAVKEAEKLFPQTFPSVVDVIKKWAKDSF